MDPGIETRHEKQRGKMSILLHRCGYQKALEAMAFVQTLGEGEVRKDGRTPKFHHQLSIARLISTLAPHLHYPEETLAAAFLHDVVEDYGVGRGELQQLFGPPVAEAVWKLTKKWPGGCKPVDYYFSMLAVCPIASIVKLADRAHNIQTMRGVFNTNKQRVYVEEVSTWFFPLIRSARRKHPMQYDAYENLKILLRCQVSLLRQVLEEDR